MSPHWKKILQEMCRRVSVDFDQIDFKKDQWYEEHQWSISDENEFKHWMINYLKENSKARKELMNWPTGRIRMIQKVVDEFVLNYGWQYENQ